MKMVYSVVPSFPSIPSGEKGLFSLFRQQKKVYSVRPLRGSDQ
jgi:hypothetical protein